MYEYYSVVESDVKNKEEVWFTIDQQVTVKYLHKAELLEVVWESSDKADMVADSICLLCL